MLSFRLKFEQFKTIALDRAKLQAQHRSRSAKALGRVGGVLRQEARKAIKKRVVTRAMWSRYHAARERKDYRAAYKIAQQIEARRETASQPGDAPFTHVPDHPVASIRAIYYAVDEQGQRVVVGPVAGNQVNDSWISGTRTTVAEMLEFGDRVQIKEWRFTNAAAMNPRWARRFKTAQRFSDQWMRQDRRWKNVARKRGKYLTLWSIGLETRQRSASYEPRPFMGPTLQRTQPAVRTILASAFVGRAA